MKPSIGEVLEHYGGRVTKTGYGWQPAKCCLHEDTHSSAQVDEEECTFRCHVCDFFGDVYALVMEKEGIGFRAAKQRAGEIAGPGDGAVSRSSRRPGSRLPKRAGNQSGNSGWIPPWSRGRPGGRP